MKRVGHCFKVKARNRAGSKDPGRCRIEEM